MVLTVFNTKGGVGKSTLSICLADVFSYSGSTCLIDLDKQGTLSKSQKIETFPHTIRTIERVQDIISLTESVIIVDCPPYLTQQTRELLELSDFVLIPIKAGFADYFALLDTLEYIQTIKTKASVVLNMVRHGNKVTPQVAELIKESGYSVMNTQLKERIAYTRAILTGSAYALDSKAAMEMNCLAAEIVDKTNK